MRGASRASLSEARDRLVAAVAEPGTAARLSDELFAVVGLLDAQPALRRALTDPTRPQAARAGLARSLLEGKVSRATLNTVGGLAAARWSAPRDLATATEQLAVLAAAAATSGTGHLDDVEDELFRFGQVVAANPALRSALSSPLAPGDLKRQLLDTLLAGKVTDTSLRLITQAAVHPRGRSLDASLTEYARLVAEWRQRLIAVVRVAVPLSDGERDRLSAVLAAVFGHGVHLDVLVDPAVLGGISVRIGDEFIDGSVASRLAALRRQLAA
ncbi:MAG TPA: F0F1 ATP synthase subunit delta [Streptosporangiaceae bacterium]|nr:F0F1 ATP synthase subunit delta [Streptosporangiaceae bacterium]